MWLDPDTYHNDAGTWLTVPLGSERYGIPWRTLYRWLDPSHGCRYLEGGRHVGNMRVAPAQPDPLHPLVLVLLEADLLTIQTARRLGPRENAVKLGQAPHQDAFGPWWTSKQLGRKLGCGALAISRWAKKPSRLRPGEKAIRSKRTIMQHRAGPSTGVLYLEPDAVNCLLGKESRLPGYARCGKERPGLDDKDKRFLKELIREKGPLPSEDVHRHARAAGISRPRLLQIRQQAGVLYRLLHFADGERRTYWFLAGQ
jgi:hypothetical protein